MDNNKTNSDFNFRHLSFAARLSPISLHSFFFPFFVKLAFPYYKIENHSLIYQFYKLRDVFAKIYYMLINSQIWDEKTRIEKMWKGSVGILKMSSSSSSSSCHLNFSLHGVVVVKQGENKVKILTINTYF